MCDSIYRDLTCAVTNENGVVEDEAFGVVEDEDLGVVEVVEEELDIVVAKNHISAMKVSRYLTVIFILVTVHTTPKSRYIMYLK
jgi:hypothetical protein